MSARRTPAFALITLTAGLAVLAPLAALAAEPASVTIAGSLQSELGCTGDWDPACAATHLAYDADDTVWQATWTVPAGSWEYKAALNDGWAENYGANATPNGANIPLALGAATDVKLYYSHATHWVTDNVNSVIAVAPGSFQSELGCPGDWQPDCLRSWLQDPDGDGTHTFTTSGLPAGDYEVKVAIGESWAVNYGAGGVQNGANIPFTVPASCTEMLFSYDSTSHVLTVGVAPGDPQPTSVTIAGSLQSELGCPGDWQPDCATTHLAYDAADTVWQATWTVPAGSWEYKAALNDSWDVNYGANATPNGANIPLALAAPTAVRFYYPHDTHWVTDNVTSVIATAPGSFQSELGCPGDWQPDCLRSWLQDPDGDGTYAFSTSGLPAGNYEVKVAVDESWDVNYGQGGVQNGANIPFTVPADCAEILFSWDSSSHVLTVTVGGAPAGNLNLARAHWVLEDTVAWGSASALLPAATVRLHGAPAGGLSLAAGGVQGATTTLVLTRDPAGLPAAVTDKFPHLAGMAAFRVAAGDLAQVPALLKGQTAISAVDDGASLLLDATSLQIPGVLDDLYTYSGPLGVELAGGVPTLRLWAPTAQGVILVLYADSSPATVPTTYPMTLDPASGVWSVAGDASWVGQYYLYQVQVWAPTTRAVETNLVTDPYSLSLAADSARSHIVDLDDPALEPAGWDSLVKPALARPEDVVVYELHVRDFSVDDQTVPAADRGTFMAFTHGGSDGMQHLAALAQAGLTHVHLLPSFDISSVPERRADQVVPDYGALAGYPPDSDQQQAIIAAVDDQDGFNWGYDPWHYTAPEGGYSTDPDGPARILEFRSMVQGLAAAGLRVVMDVVYNHTTAAGQNDHSVLDKVVPGYYHRLNADGAVETSSCCPNTATEHAMMEKLMVDSLLTWATAYKVDGFRFDLMGHHMLANMVHAADALHALTPAGHGVDGAAIYLYGEAWNFGEVANNARGVNATQANIGGTGIGTFNDRVRDGVRGGGPFSGLQEQGFATGLSYDPNATDQGTPAEQLDRLLQRTDWIRVSLAGNLAGYTLVDRFGTTVTGHDVDYNGQPAGYAQDPQEVVNYCSAHDNETLFDAVQLKAPLATSMADRVRMQNLALDLVVLGQGVPFVHAGDDMLRSKSLDRNSYNSGDWFNRLDFTYGGTNWGHGLPMAGDNQSNWPVMQPLLANPSLAPATADILAANAHLREVLAIRRSSGLFRLATAAEVESVVGFLNTGPSQVPGLIVMTLTDPARELDPSRGDLVVLFNASDEPQVFAAAAYSGHDLALHPVQAASADPVVRTASFDRATGAFSVPARTTAVFATIAAGFQVAPSTLLLAEPAGSATVTVTLDTEPTAPVTVGLASLDLTECTVSAPSVTLDAASWSTGATVLVSAVADLTPDGDQPCLLETTADGATADPGYRDLDPPDVLFTVVDDGVPVELERLTAE